MFVTTFPFTARGLGGDQDRGIGKLIHRDFPGEVGIITGGAGAQDFLHFFDHLLVIHFEDIAGGTEIQSVAHATATAATTAPAAKTAARTTPSSTAKPAGFGATAAGTAAGGFGQFTCIIFDNVGAGDHFAVVERPQVPDAPVINQRDAVFIGKSFQSCKRSHFHADGHQLLVEILLHRHGHEMNPGLGRQHADHVTQIGFIEIQVEGRRTDQTFAHRIIIRAHIDEGLVVRDASCRMGHGRQCSEQSHSSNPQREAR